MRLVSLEEEAGTELGEGFSISYTECLKLFLSFAYSLRVHKSLLKVKESVLGCLKESREQLILYSSNYIDLYIPFSLLQYIVKLLLF